MKIVGITGGIGSGKTTVCKIFEILNIPVYQADDRAKYLMQKDAELKQQIVIAFGQDAYKEGQLNRPYLANIVFNDPEKTKIINTLVHPAVGRDFAEWLGQQDAPYVIKEAALLIESGSYKQLDALINVFAPIGVRVARVTQRDPQRSLEEIEGIISKQVKEDTRADLADFQINNDGSVLLIPQVLAIHKRLST